MAGYDASKDPYCWWSDSNCVTPKVSYLPKDIYMCPNAGDWGLNYDDGPYNPSDDDKELNKYAEPELYNFLAKNKNQKATLFVSDFTPLKIDFLKAVTNFFFPESILVLM
jgi:hypothetical protein